MTPCCLLAGGDVLLSIDLVVQIQCMGQPER
jgi:hypothetical protein